MCVQDHSSRATTSKISAFRAFVRKQKRPGNDPRRLALFHHRELFFRGVMSVRAVVRVRACVLFAVQPRTEIPRKF